MSSTISSLPICNEKEFNKEYYISETNKKEWHTIGMLQWLYSVFGFLFIVGIYTMTKDNQRNTKNKIFSVIFFLIFIICLPLSIVKRKNVIKTASCVNSEGRIFTY